MIVKFVLSTVLNFLAATTPAVIAYFKFGPEARVDAHDPRQTAYIAGLMMVTFFFALLANLVARKSQPSGLEEVAAQLVKTAIRTTGSQKAA